MPNTYNKLVNRLLNRPLSVNEFETFLKSEDFIFDFELEFELLKSSGIPLSFSNEKVYLRSTITPINSDRFCIVDIETNGHDPIKHQPIEIGAIMYSNGNVEREFNTLISCDYIPQAIIELTGISVDMLDGAPNLKSALESFRIFLGDSIFVAHNVDFDFNFLSNCMEYNNFGYLYNFKICTIKLIKKIMQSNKYSLSYLNEVLDINHYPLHRALDDSVVTLEVFKYCLKSIPNFVYTSQDLIKFATN